MAEKINKKQATLYSLVPLKAELRTTFNLPASPYLKSVFGDDARQYLHQLGVIFFRDEDHGNGLLFQPAVGAPLEERSGLIAYRSAGVFEITERGDWKIAGWNKPREAYVKSKGDDRAWVAFNKEVRILSIDAGQVHLA